MSKGTAETDRALAMAMWSHSSVGRSDDVRLFYLADLITPQYIPAVGECRHQLMQLSGSSFSVSCCRCHPVQCMDPALCPVLSAVPVSYAADCLWLLTQSQQLGDGRHSSTCAMAGALLQQTVHWSALQLADTWYCCCAATCR
jgi:hypothetical protein